MYTFSAGAIEIVSYNLFLLSIIKFRPKYQS